MKKIALVLFVAACFVSVAQAQFCGDIHYVTQGAGVFPKPDNSGGAIDTLGMNSGPACVGSTNYQFKFTAVITNQPVTISGFSVTLDTVTINPVAGANQGITGLPAGFTYDCGVPNCKFFISNSGMTNPSCATVRCANVTAAAADYPLAIYATVKVTLAGTSTHLTLPVCFGNCSNPVLPGSYILHVVNASDPRCGSGTRESNKTNFAVSQNQPNPFNGETEIMVNAENAGKYQFSVYNLLGETIHSETVNFIAGQNTIRYQAANLAAGIYTYSVGNENGVVTKRMVISK